MEKENYKYSNYDLTILRRLWEIQKKQFLDSKKSPAVKYLSNPRTIGLWKGFMAEGGHNLLNGGPDNFISACEEILYSPKWVSPAFQVEGSPFNKDEVRRYNH